MKKIKSDTDSPPEIKHKEAISLPKLLIDGEIKQFRRLWRVDIKRMRTRETQNITQDNVRLKRIKDRAKGVRFALGYSPNGFRKRRKWSRHCEIWSSQLQRLIKLKEKNSLLKRSCTWILVLVILVIFY